MSTCMWRWTKGLVMNLCAVMLAVPAVLAQGQVLDGAPLGASLGDFAPASSVAVDLPDNGVLYYDSVNIPAGVTVTFNKPASGLNPCVYMLASGPIVIDGQIRADGAYGTATTPGVGGPCGFAGGKPAIPASGIAAGAGAGPGGGQVSNGRATGIFGSDGEPRSYGTDLLVPMVGGSGGAGYSNIAGGGGGGGILIASNVSINVAGYVRALGAGDSGSNYYVYGYSGSGGGVRFVAPIVGGDGQINVGTTRASSVTWAGRIRIDSLDKTGIAFTYAPSGVTPSIGTFLSAMPTGIPELEILEVAGNTITGGAAVTFILPLGATADQVVRVRASDFDVAPTNVVITLTPDEGNPTNFPVTFSGPTGPWEADTTVTFAYNNPTRVHVWTQ